MPIKDGLKAAVCFVLALNYIEESDIFGAVPVRKKNDFKGGIHCISRSSQGTFILCAGTHWSN